MDVEVDDRATDDRARREAAGRRRAAVLRRALRWLMVALACSVVGLGFMVFQAFAVRDGLERWANWHEAVDWLAAVGIAFTPVIGSVVAGAAAVAGWEWSVPLAVAVFALPIAVFALQHYAKQRGLALKARANGAFSGEPVP